MFFTHIYCYIAIPQPEDTLVFFLMDYCIKSLSHTHGKQSVARESFFPHSVLPSSPVVSFYV